MYTFFLICAGLGGTFVLLQFLAGAFGFGADHGDADGHNDFHDGADHDAEHPDGNWFLGLLTLRAICAAITFFGLGGLTAHYYGLTTTGQIALALIAGFGAMYLVATLMKMLYRLRADGTVRMDHAVGRTGTVYLRVPAAKAGPGKVTLNLQNRTVEVEAFSAAGELPTGTPIRVIAVLGPSSVEVTHATSEA